MERRTQAVALVGPGFSGHEMSLRLGFEMKTAKNVKKHKEIIRLCQLRISQEMVVGQSKQQRGWIIVLFRPVLLIASTHPRRE